MREILFRGKAKANDEGISFDGWVYGSLLIRYCGEYEICGRNNSISFVMPVIPETVGQFTGLYDEHGNKVFEGDVLQFRKADGSAPYRRTATIAYGSWNCSCCDGIYGWYSEGQDCIRGLYESSDEIEGTSGYVIIGNIHDNPELVKEETK